MSARSRWMRSSYCAITPSIQCSDHCGLLCCHCMSGCCREAAEGCICCQHKCYSTATGCTGIMCVCNCMCLVSACAFPCQKVSRPRVRTGVGRRAGDDAHPYATRALTCAARCVDGARVVSEHPVPLDGVLLDDWPRMRLLQDGRPRCGTRRGYDGRTRQRRRGALRDVRHSRRAGMLYAERRCGRMLWTCGADVICLMYFGGRTGFVW